MVVAMDSPPLRGKHIEGMPQTILKLAKSQNQKQIITYLMDGKKKEKKKKGGLHLLVQKEIYYNKSQNLNFLYHKLIQLQLSWSVGRKDEKIRL